MRRCASSFKATVIIWCLEQWTSISGGHQLYSVHQELYPLPQIQSAEVKYLHTHTHRHTGANAFRFFGRNSEELFVSSLAGETSKMPQISVTCRNTSISVIMMRRKSPTVQTSAWATSHIKPGRISRSSAGLWVWLLHRKMVWFMNMSDFKNV